MPYKRARAQAHRSGIVACGPTPRPRGKGGGGGALYRGARVGRRHAARTRLPDAQLLSAATCKQAPAVALLGFWPTCGQMCRLLAHVGPDLANLGPYLIHFRLSLGHSDRRCKNKFKRLHAQQIVKSVWPTIVQPWPTFRLTPRLPAGNHIWPTVAHIWPTMAHNLAHSWPCRCLRARPRRALAACCRGFSPRGRHSARACGTAGLILI